MWATAGVAACDGARGLAHLPPLGDVGREPQCLVGTRVTRAPLPQPGLHPWPILVSPSLCARAGMGCYRCIRSCSCRAHSAACRRDPSTRARRSAGSSRRRAPGQLPYNRFDILVSIFPSTDHLVTPLMHPLVHPLYPFSRCSWDSLLPGRSRSRPASRTSPRKRQTPSSSVWRARRSLRATRSTRCGAACLSMCK